MGENKHEHGSMNIEAQEKAFAGLMRAATNVVIFSAVFLIFLYLVNG